MLSSVVHCSLQLHWCLHLYCCLQLYCCTCRHCCLKLCIAVLSCKALRVIWWGTVTPSTALRLRITFILLNLVTGALIFSVELQPAGFEACVWELGLNRPIALLRYLIVIALFCCASCSVLKLVSGKSSPCNVTFKVTTEVPEVEACADVICAWPSSAHLHLGCCLPGTLPFLLRNRL